MQRREGFAFAVLALIVLALPANLSQNNYQVQSPIEITSVMTGRLLGTTWVKNDEFLHDETMSVNVTAQNSAQDEESTTIYASAYDEINVPFGSAMVDITLPAGEAESVFVSIYVPTWAFSGNECQVVVSALSGNETSHMFSLLPQTSGHLIVNCFTQLTSLEDLDVVVDGYLYQSFLTIALPPGNHTVQVPSRPVTMDERLTKVYVFLNWSDGSILTSRTVNIAEGTNNTLTAYFKYYTTIGFRRVVPTPAYNDGCTF